MVTAASGASASFLARSFRVSSTARSASCIHLPTTTRLSSPPPLRCIAQSAHDVRSLTTWSRKHVQHQYQHPCPARTGSLCATRPTFVAGNYRNMSSIGSNNNNSNNSRGDGKDRVNHSLHGTFVTGYSWDMPTKPAVAPTTPSESASATPRAPAPRIWEVIKEEIGNSGLEDKENKENSRSNIQMNLKKLEAISRVTKKKQAYSPYLLISSLPPTVMPDDIRRMAVAEGSMTDIIYHRNKYMEFQNRVTVVFRSSTDAVEFIAQKYGKFLGGHKLNMNMLDPYNSRDKGLIPPQLPPEPLSGQLVLISGLPAASRPDSLRTEFRRFHLMDTTEAAIISVPSRRMASTCQYLIRLSSRSEAYRFVRTYHNTYFQYQQYRRRCPVRATVIY